VLGLFGGVLLRARVHSSALAGAQDRVQAAERGGEGTRGGVSDAMRAGKGGATAVTERSLAPTTWDLLPVVAMQTSTPHNWQFGVSFNVPI
jgi:hypothetical protein